MAEKEVSKRMQRFQLQKEFGAEVASFIHVADVMFNKLVDMREKAGKSVELAIDIPTGDVEVKNGRKMKVTETLVFDANTWRAFTARFKQYVHNHGHEVRELSKRTVDPNKVTGLAMPSTYSSEWIAYVKACLKDKLVTVSAAEKKYLEEGICSILVARRIMQLDCDAHRPANVDAKVHAVTPNMKAHLKSAIGALKTDGVDVDAFRFPVLSKIAGHCSINKANRSEADAERIGKQEVVDAILHIHEVIRKHEEGEAPAANGHAAEPEEEAAAPAPVAAKKEEPEVAPSAAESTSVRRPGGRRAVASN